MGDAFFEIFAVAIADGAFDGKDGLHRVGELGRCGGAADDFLFFPVACFADGVHFEKSIEKRRAQVSFAVYGNNFAASKRGFVFAENVAQISGGDAGGGDGVVCDDDDFVGILAARALCVHELPAQQ